jgi:hypothetical protein
MFLAILMELFMNFSWHALIWKVIKFKLFFNCSNSIVLKISLNLKKKLQLLIYLQPAAFLIQPFSFFLLLAFASFFQAKF